MDLFENQSAINKMILRVHSGFLVYIERTFIFKKKVLIICKGEKILEWAKHVVEANEPSLVDHQGCDAKGLKDSTPAKTFRIWLPEDESSSISNTRKLISGSNAKISLNDLESKHSAKRKGEVLHVVSVRKPLLTSLEELQYNP